MTYKKLSNKAGKKFKSGSKQITQEQNLQLKGWFNKSISVKCEQAVEIGNFEGHKLFGYISPRYDELKWSNALNKGFASGAAGRNGVKNLSKKLVELKINEGARLYTKQLYKNESGNYLAIFDKEDSNHSKVGKVTNSSKGFHIIEVDEFIDVDVMGAENNHESYFDYAF